MILNFKNYTLFMASWLMIFASGCEKYLDKKPNENQVVPVTLKDAQALIDYDPKINKYDLNSGEFSSDDYSLPDSRFLVMSENYRRMYTWEKDFLFAPNYNDWSNLYNTVYIANTALETVSNVARTGANGSEWDNVKGQALYIRAHFYLQGAIIWCPAYEDSSNEPGLPLRLNTNFNEKSVRASLTDTYQQIINDLEQAIQLLPDAQISLTRPSKQSAYALLARVYLAMRNYDMVGKYAELCLEINRDLLNYSLLNPLDAYPISQLNNEVLFHSRMSTPIDLTNIYAVINKDLFDSYEDNDLRKTVFFMQNNDGSHGFKGSYDGGLILFSGISKNEVYLMSAEALARQGKIDEAMTRLNELLIQRWAVDPVTKATLYVDQTASDKNDAINKILLERRKELIMRGLRWMDIKRLNKEGYNISLSRNIDEKVYNLPANDLRFSLPIPEDVIAISGMEQNRR